MQECNVKSKDIIVHQILTTQDSLLFRVSSQKELMECKFFLRGDSKSVPVWWMGELLDDAIVFYYKELNKWLIREKVEFKPLFFSHGKKLSIQYDFQTDKKYSGEFPLGDELSLYDYFLYANESKIRFNLKKKDYVFSINSIERCKNFATESVDLIDSRLDEGNNIIINVNSSINGGILYLLPRQGGKDLYKNIDYGVCLREIKNIEKPLIIGIPDSPGRGIYLISEEELFNIISDYNQDYYFDLCVFFENNFHIAIYDLKISDETYSLNGKRKVILSGTFVDEETKDYIEYAFIKSGLGGTVIKVHKKRRLECKVEGFLFNQDKISIHFSNTNFCESYDKSPCVLRLTKKDRNLVSNSAEYKCIVINRDVLFEMSSKEFLKDVIKGKDENYKCEIVFAGEIYNISCDLNLGKNYIEIADGYKVLFYKDKAGRLRICTHETDFAKIKNKTRIAVLGSCFSRQIFSSDEYFNSDYKKFYVCGYTQFHSSIISLCSKPINYDIQQYYDYFDEAARRYLPAEFDKDFFDRVRKDAPDYLVIDLYADAVRPIICIEKNKYITCNKYLNQIPFEHLFQSKYVFPGSKEHQDLLKQYMLVFHDKILDIINEERLILLMGRFSSEYINEKTNEINEWSLKEKIKSNNENWNVADSIFLEVFPNARVIDQRNTQWRSDYYSPIVGGASPSHYQKWYYRDSLNLLNKIVLNDLLQGND